MLNAQAKYRGRLPQLSDQIFLTDGGMETTLIFHEGIDLPLFMAFPLLDQSEGLARVRDYYRRYCRMAKDAGLGFVLESPTWRANADWAAKIGYSRTALAGVNRKAIDLMLEMGAEFETPRSPMVISGNIGPRGDGYVPGQMMSAQQSEDYHGEQIGVFRDTAADLVSAFTLNYANEAVGIARAAKASGMPVVISFTVETDGRLPTGQTLKDAVAEVDAETGSAPVYYMLNCAHPTHFAGALAPGESWMKRFRGLRANASKCSHAELEAMTELDVGDPVDLGRHYADLRRRFRHINVLGGCCGTDHRHVEQIALACEPVT
jgi:S-methylmethionine-dependent homocysteine/selenocysteine methylase